MGGVGGLPTGRPVRIVAPPIPASALRLALLAACTLLVGCGTANPIKDYPTFPDRYAEARATRVLTDVLVAEDVRGRTDQVTLSTNREIAGALTDSLAAWLGARGYAVDTTYPAAVGLYFDGSVAFTVREDDAAEADSAAAAPYAVDPAVLADTLMLAAFEGARPGGRPMEYVAVDPEALVLLVVRGRRVPVGKSIAQGIVTGVMSGLLTGGLVSASMWQQSFAAAELTVVDAATGDVIWRDARVVEGTASDRTLRDAVRWMVDRMPDRASPARG